MGDFNRPEKHVKIITNVVGAGVLDSPKKTYNSTWDAENINPIATKIVNVQTKF